VEKEAARVSKSLLTDEAFVVLKQLGIFLLKQTPEVRAVVISEQGETWKTFVALFAFVFSFPRVLSQAGFSLCMLVVGGTLRLSRKSSRMPSRVIRLFFCRRLLLN